MVLLDMLADIDFLRGLVPDYLQHIARLGRLQEYDAGSVHFREGEACDRVFLVTEGEVSLEIEVPGRGARPIRTARAGELVGWSPVIGVGAMTATARAVSRCRLIALDVGSLLALCRHHPDFGMEFVRRTAVVLARRLHETRLRLLENHGG
jgi:CRP-like cAMP-binding protein